MRLFSTLLGLTAVLLCAPPTAFAQGSQADFERAAQLPERFGNLVEDFHPEIEWLADGSGLWWSSAGPEGSRAYVRVDLPSGKRSTATDPAELGLAPVATELQPQATWSGSRQGGRASSIEFVNTFDRAVRLFWARPNGSLVSYGEVAAGETRSMSTFARHVFVLDFTANDLAGIFVAESWPKTARIDTESQRIAMQPKAEAPKPAQARLEIRDHNVFWVAADGSATAWTSDGTAKDSYQGRFHWSPDRKRVLAFQTQVFPKRQIPLVESSPKDQVQPKLTWRDYNKPGDPVDQLWPRLFDTKTGAVIPVDDEPFQDSFAVGSVHWAPDSSQVFCQYNRRGHQQVALRAIDADTGAVSTLVDERSATFVDYSQKLQRRWLDSRGELLWCSERDGHNHVYRYDTRTGKLLNQVTQGPWVVRRIVAVDEDQQVLWFHALGILPDQDPYFEHLARVRFDGSDLVVLTAGDGTHETTLSPDRRWFIDRWSRVDQPPITEVRSALDGKLVAELGRADASALLAEGFLPALPFVAKGRDGQTDIHGILLKPSTFDPKRTYPVIEAIYAGPHDHFVPKAWGLHLRNRQLAELGFLVVQIDGMGTNWRSKAFHDVCWQNLKDAGLPDRILWMQAAAKKYPQMDLTRVGIFGGSAGGQSALAALLHHGDFYKAAASDCGCHDNRMDKIWWNEAWMGKLGAHYAENSNVTHANKLTGKLLLTVGELDTNVDPASTLQVVDALVRADKDFEFHLIPGGGHGIGESPYLFRKRQDFFVRALYGLEPRH